MQSYPMVPPRVSQPVLTLGPYQQYVHIAAGNLIIHGRVCERCDPAGRISLTPSNHKMVIRLSMEYLKQPVWVSSFRQSLQVTHYVLQRMLCKGLTDWRTLSFLYRLQGEFHLLIMGTCFSIQCPSGHNGNLSRYFPSSCVKIAIDNYKVKHKRSK